MKTNDAYLGLAKKLGAPLSKRFLAILEAMFTPEECAVLMELFAPATCPELSHRLNLDENALSVMLENLVKRGVLTSGKTQYAFHPGLLAFHHDVLGGPSVEPVPDKVKELWGDFFFNEWWKSFLDEYIERKQSTGWPVHRVWPAIGALELSPDIRPEEILPEEDFRLTLENAKRRIIGRCGCRKVWAQCDNPLETCFASLDNARGEYFLGKPGRALREISLEEALDIVRKNEEAGLVHIGACYCCNCCCQILYTIKRANRYDLLGSSRYRARVNKEKCVGCQDCVEKCPFDAIEMRKSTDSKKLKASVDSEKCMGCGVCIVGCKQRALTYELVKPPEHILKPHTQPSGISVARPNRLPPGTWGFYDLK